MNPILALSQRRSRGRAAVVVLCGGLLASLAAVVSAAAPAEAAGLPTPPRENVAFFYESVKSNTNAELQSKLANTHFVVLSTQGNPDSPGYWQEEATAAQRIKQQTGAWPLHYVDYVWRRTGQNSFGINLSEHPEWRLCYQGSQKAVSAERDRSSGGYYIDMNERGARQAADNYLYKLKQAGYAGFMYDIGRRTFVHGLPHTMPDGRRLKLANMRSGCTTNPVVKGRTVSQGYLAAIDNMRAKHGRFTVLNCCVPSELSRSSVVGATYIRDTAHRFLNEATKSSVSWNKIQALSAESQRSRKVWSFQCAETPNLALYSWARAKMWRQPVALNTGEGATSGACKSAVNQWGVWGELSNARLGAPLDSGYRRGQCEPRSTSQCVFWRRYTNGLVVVNNGRYKLGTGVTVPLTGGTMPSCVYAAEVRVPSGGTTNRLLSPGPVAGNKCIKGLYVSAWRNQGRVFLYSSARW